MGTTSNYSWPYPEATGLVKDGWEDIKDLATSIDTTAAASFGGGLVKINTTSFTNVASQSINDVFSSTYQNYLITGVVKNTAGDAALQFRLRVSSTDSTANYDRATWYYTWANPTVWNNYVSSTGGAEQPIGGHTTTNGFFHLNVSSPNIADRTTFWGGTSSTAHFLSGGTHTSATAYTGFTIYPSSNNMTGYVTVFGVKK